VWRRSVLSQTENNVIHLGRSVWEILLFYEIRTSPTCFTVLRAVTRFCKYLRPFGSHIARKQRCRKIFWDSVILRA
jgi:hypothetical protein